MSQITAPTDHYDLYAEPRWADDLRNLPSEGRRRRRVVAAAVGGFVAAAGLGAAAAVMLGGPAPGGSSPGAPPVPSVVEEIADASAVEPEIVEPATTQPDEVPAVDIADADVDVDVAVIDEPVAVDAVDVGVDESAASESGGDSAESSATVDVGVAVDPLPSGHRITIPVGPDGVEYGGQDFFPEGPTAVAVDDTGTVHVGDPTGVRILNFHGDERTEIDLAAFGAYWVDDIVAHGEELIVLETFLSGPVQERVYRIGLDGQLRETIEIPSEFGTSAMLTGLVDTGDGRIVLEYGLGREYAQWSAETGTFSSTDLVVDGAPVSKTDFPLTIGDAAIAPTPPEGADGNVRYGGITDDGTFVLIDEWMLIDDEGYIRAGMDLEWHSPTGYLLGTASFIDDTHTSEYSIGEFAVTGDGRAFALHSYPDRVEVYELLPR